MLERILENSSLLKIILDKEYVIIFHSEKPAKRHFFLFYVTSSV